MAKRLLDFGLGLFAFLVLSPVMLLISFLVLVSSSGPILHWSSRVGQKNKIFKMPKFRTMRVGTPAVATDLLSDPGQWLTPIGSFLRKTSLDELPQLWSIIMGDMSFVGPRPALFNQYDLIRLRTKAGVEILLPGLTGWAQVQGRDNLSLAEKLLLDIEYLKKRSFLFDLYIIAKTFWRILDLRSVSHLIKLVSEKECICISMYCLFCRCHVGRNVLWFWQ
jgi:O-antigen biosynthesis protein WbqP